MKNSILHNVIPLSAAISIALLSGCQESSDGGKSGGEQMIQITHDNARGLSGRSVNSSSSSTSILDKKTASGRTINAELKAMIPRASSQSSTTQNNTIKCDNGGTITILSTDDLNGDGEIDAFEAQIDNCKTDDGTETNGDLSLKSTRTSTSEKTILTSKQLSITDQGETTTLENMQMAMTNSKTGYTYDFDTNLITSEGRIIIETDPAFEGLRSNKNPDTGKMTIKGSNGSSISFDADTGSNATVQLTVNDGASTKSEVVRWDELTSSTEESSTEEPGTEEPGTEEYGNEEYGNEEPGNDNPDKMSF
jgi:hypothetical protein